MIYGIIGTRGSGKTITMVKHAIDDLYRGRELYLNFHLSMENIDKKYHSKIHILDENFFKEYANFKLYDCTLLLDEVYVYIDARSSGSKRNKIWSYFINQTRKRGVDLYFTTQFLRQVEIRLRMNTDYFIFPRFYKTKKGDYIKCKYIRYADRLIPIKTVVYLANNYYKYYDTDEIIDFDNLEVKK